MVQGRVESQACDPTGLHNVCYCPLKPLSYLLTNVRENQKLRRQAEDLRTQHLADSAKINRQTELLVQHRNAAIQKEKRYHREISELYQQLNSV